MTTPVKSSGRYSQMARTSKEPGFEEKGNKMVPK